MLQTAPLPGRAFSNYLYFIDKVVPATVTGRFPRLPAHSFRRYPTHDFPFNTPLPYAAFASRFVPMTNTIDTPGEQSLMVPAVLGKLGISNGDSPGGCTQSIPPATSVLQ